MLHIYVDGSCIGNQNVEQNTPAGWGVVVITGSNDLGRGNGEILHEFHGKVITDGEDDGFIGAEVGSNNTAELSAFAGALRWILLQVKLIGASKPLERNQNLEYGQSSRDGNKVQ